MEPKTISITSISDLSLVDKTTKTKEMGAKISKGMGTQTFRRMGTQISNGMVIKMERW